MGGAIGFLVEETTGGGVAFDPPIRVRVVGLATVSDRAAAVAIAGGRIGCHGLRNLVRVKLT